MSMRFYNEKIKNYFLNSEYSGTLGQDLPCVYTIDEGSVKLGKLIIFQIMLDNTKSYIKDVKYKVYGCGATIATIEWLARQIINQNIVVLDSIKIEDINNGLELPKNKLHCAITAEDILMRLKLLITGNIN